MFVISNTQDKNWDSHLDIFSEVDILREDRQREKKRIQGGKNIQMNVFAKSSTDVVFSSKFEFKIKYAN